MSSEMDDDTKEVDDARSEPGEDGNQDDFERFDEDEAGDDEALDSEDDSDGSVQKDDTEEELERLVFGDTAGFKQDIKTWKTSEKDEDAIPDHSLTAIDDGEV